MPRRRGRLRRVDPQRGPQSEFLECQADIAIYGGAAGGGKTWALLLEPIRYRKDTDFSAVFFRRTTVQIRNPGGLWDESVKLFLSARRAGALGRLVWNGGFLGGARLDSPTWSTRRPSSTGAGRAN